MKNVTIISGKGGTGKTSLVAAFAQLGSPLTLADCDVDASNLELILEGESRSEDIPYSGGLYAKIDDDLCTGCGKCAEVCRFDAVEYPNGADENPVINYYFCEGCGLCYDVCPADAISLEDRASGKVFMSQTRFGPLVHAELAVAEGTSGKLVSLVRENAGRIAEEEKHGIVLIDGAPGIGCPVIASLASVDVAVIITEPTMSGMHDLARVAELTEHFNIKTGVIINKYDLNEEQAGEIEKYCMGKGIEVLGRVGYDRKFVDSLVQGKTVLESGDVGIRDNLEGIWGRIVDMLK